MKYVYKNADNSIGHMTLLCNSNPAEFLPEGATLIGPIGEDTMPEHGLFKSAWRQVAGGKVRPNMALARAEKLEQIRAERDKRLLASDAEYVKLHSQDQDLTALKAMKQALRDLPESVELALDEIDDIEDLAAYEPEWP